MANRNIKPVIEELKGKLPTKEQILKRIEDFDLQIDTKKLRSKGEEIQNQVFVLARQTADNPTVKLYTRNFLSSDITSKTILKLKEVLPNQSLLDKIEEARLSYLKQEEPSKKPEEANVKSEEASVNKETKEKKPSNVEMKTKVVASEEPKPTENKEAPAPANEKVEGNSANASEGPTKIK